MKNAISHTCGVVRGFDSKWDVQRAGFLLDLPNGVTVSIHAASTSYAEAQHEVVESRFDLWVSTEAKTAEVCIFRRAEDGSIAVWYGPTDGGYSELEENWEPVGYQTAEEIAKLIALAVRLPDRR